MPYLTEGRSRRPGALRYELEAYSELGLLVLLALLFWGVVIWGGYELARLVLP